MQDTIRIVTYHSAPNYGAVLQAYALQCAIVDMGYPVSFVDYRPGYAYGVGGIRLPLDKRRLRSCTVSLYLMYKWLRNRLSGDQTERMFDEFVARNLKVEGQRYSHHRQLRRRPPQGRCFICGSDQIWNTPTQFELDPAFLLDFGDNEQRRISYAASFGKPMLDPFYHDRFKQLAGRFDALSVRERSGVDLVRQLTGREAAWVPDPVLLRDDFPEAETPGPEQAPYLFAYTLRSKETALAAQSLVAERLGLEIVTAVGFHQRWEPLGKAVTPTPFEWTGWIKNARFVVTNSYHGLLFSIIFRRPFLYVGLPGEKAALNERAASVLQRLGLRDRLISSVDADAMDALTRQNIDWDAVHARIAEWREEGRAFLQQWIGPDMPASSVANTQSC